jgi:hypothetical protein
MNASKLLLAVLMICMIPMFSCSDDDDDDDGGSGDRDPTIDCAVDFCVDDADLFAACEADFENCIDEGLSTDEECETQALTVCEIDLGVLCNEDLCALDPDLKDQCMTLIALCIADEPEFNREECLAVGLVVCNEPV